MRGSRCDLAKLFARGGRILKARTAAGEASENVVELVLDSLGEDKAQQILTVDLKGKASFADAMVIASGRSQRHVSAISDHLVRRLKEAGFGRCRVEGLPSADWVLIDAGDVIVHVFKPDVRAFYNLEKIWGADQPVPQFAS